MNDILLRSAREQDLEELVRLEHSVEASLPSRDIFAVDEKEFYEPILRGEGHILLAFDGQERIAGVSVIRFPGRSDPDNLGRGLLPEERLDQVRHLESVFVRPDMQGNRLAERLVRENMRLTDQSGRTISMATAWPGNAASLKLHLNLGLFIRAFAFKYGGKARLILMSGGKADRSVPPRLVESMDIDGHLAALDAGLAGAGLRRTPGESSFMVEYFPLPPA
ncbi:GNAT family N-acetyltransferase [Mailhella massiliensis]|uniref:GNAT family N-acetyltransferase n=1 Tax=Mailhella massiliensis TaxID=1903261 RepID=UPI0023548D86|nr:GNAT family N-acetyltransferase [Mailhella massiliensis]